MYPIILVRAFLLAIPLFVSGAVTEPRTRLNSIGLNSTKIREMVINLIKSEFDGLITASSKPPVNSPTPQQIEAQVLETLEAVTGLQKQIQILSQSSQQQIQEIQQDCRAGRVGLLGHEAINNNNYFSDPTGNTTQIVVREALVTMAGNLLQIKSSLALPDPPALELSQVDCSPRNFSGTFREVHNICYGNGSRPLIQGLLTKARNSQGQICFPNNGPGYISSLSNQDMTSDKFTRLHGLVCPGYEQTTKCIDDHIRTSCNICEIRDLKSDVIFNFAILRSEAICQPVESNRFLETTHNVHSTGLGRCLQTHSITENCSLALEGDYQQGRFDEITKKLFDCIQNSVRQTCEEGNVGTLKAMLDADEARTKYWMSGVEKYWSKFVHP